MEGFEPAVHRGVLVLRMTPLLRGKIGSLGWIFFSQTDLEVGNFLGEMDAYLPNGTDPPQEVSSSAVPKNPRLAPGTNVFFW